MQYVPGMPWQGSQWTNQQLAQWYWWQNHMMLNKKEKGKNVQANINQNHFLNHRSNKSLISDNFPPSGHK